MPDLEETVRSRYAEAARRIAAGPAQSCCGDGCCVDGCCETAPDPVAVGYDPDELRAVGMTEDASLGCGRPTAVADLRLGETVLDLGSGAGLDVLLAARQVGPAGHAYGLDMTDEMLALASKNQARSGVTNATFVRGRLEAIPLPDQSVDVVVSNCVINLTTDKARVLAEAYRVLRPGGRLAISDLVEVEPLPVAIKSDVNAWAGCVAGTISVPTYEATLRSVGFVGVSLTVTRSFTPSDAGLGDASGRLGSADIRARKPDTVAASS